MNEAEVVEQLVNFTNILLAGVSVLFTVVSVYIAALNYFIGQAEFAAKFLSFLFVSVIIAALVFVLLGAQATQQGLIARLQEIAQSEGLSAAGRAVLANASPRAEIGGLASIDDAVQVSSWIALGLIYLSLAYLTFLHRWRAEVIPIAFASAPKESTKDKA